MPLHIHFGRPRTPPPPPREEAYIQRHIVHLIPAPEARQPPTEVEPPASTGLRIHIGEGAFEAQDPEVTRLWCGTGVVLLSLLVFREWYLQ